MVRENPVPAEDSANSDTGSPGAVWAASAKELTAKGVADGTYDTIRGNLLAAVADFAERHNVLPVVKTTASLWGYGEVGVQFATPGGEWWCALQELIEPTGVSYEDLLREFQLDLEDDLDDVAVMTWDGASGETHHLELVQTSFAVRIFMGISPWASEFAKAIRPLLCRALADSGLGDALGPVVQIHEDGTVERTNMSFTEFMAGGEPLPTEEEARRQAFGGPAVAL